MPSIAEQIGQEKVAAVVAAFYSAVRSHPSLAQPFMRVTDWPSHLAHLSHFWWMTLGGSRYLDHHYNVTQRHAEAGFTPVLLADWLSLFRQTLYDALPTDLADAWMLRAERIGTSLALMYEHGHFPQVSSH